jgi:hypothetical protein
VATVNVQIAANNKGEASDLMLENVEALADESSGSGVSTCSIEWYVNIIGSTVKCTCSATCSNGQKAQCKPNACKCV